MKIGLYFGSFNPIHIGHLIIAEHVATFGYVKEIWFIVSPQNPLKQSASLLNEYHRFHLVQLAIDDNPKFKASNIEFKLPKPSYTIDTITILKEKYPQHNFSIIIGSDSFQNLPKWKNSELLMKENHFIVYERPGFPIKNENKNITLLTAPLFEISSTVLRERIKLHQSIKYLVPEEVRIEIENQNYFKELEKPAKDKK